MRGLRSPQGTRKTVSRLLGLQEAPHLIEGVGRSL